FGVVRVVIVVLGCWLFLLWSVGFVVLLLCVGGFVVVVGVWVRVVVGWFGPGDYLGAVFLLGVRLCVFGLSFGRGVDELVRE
ncbi:hypothetical protein, partial [Pseudomonas syringae group genomosp. 7]|uniref:hypothetical protein n=1 Tax=Pseudomonas syringae group genomosp. 7 TaxID=251699 RepID=UPI00376FCCF5